ncbi:MAG TPA: Cof-type HAD-IIB family hydrolase, partial [Bacilli bacterium]
LNDDRIITQATKDAITAAIQRGAIITLATGRMYASAKKVARQLELNVPLITYQGSLVKNLLDEQVLYERYVPRNAAMQIFDYAYKHGLQLQAYHEDMLYTREFNAKVADYVDMNQVPYIVEPDFDKLLDKRLTKLLIIDEPDYLDRLKAEWEPLIGAEVHLTKSKPYFLEFLHKEGTKGHAVKFLANHYGFDLSEVIAIGDAWNDHEMVEIAGLGVAMGNAIPALKHIADYITLSNNDDGVKHVIEKFILHPQEVRG